MKLRALSGIAVVTLLSACGSEPERDVQYYLDHASERTAKITECTGNPGKLDRTVNCINAKKAQMRQDFSSENTGMPEIR